MLSSLPAILTLATGLQVPPQDEGRLKAQVDSLVAPLVASKDFAGTVLIARGADTLVLSSFGSADIERDLPNSGSTPMRVGSISKQFTAAAVLLLQEDGLLDVEDPLSRFMPDFPRGGEIRLHDLLAHRSGVVRDVFEDWTQRRRPRTLDEVIEEIARHPLDFEPGERTSYSNAGYTLLAKVVEEVSNESFSSFMRQRVFDSLEMKDTFVLPGSAEEAGRMATGYDPGPYPTGLIQTPHEAPSNTMGADGVVSTVGDLHRWSAALESRGLLSEESRRQMFTVYGDGRGYGVAVGNREGELIVGHDGVTHGFIAFVERHFGPDLTLVLLGNVRTGVLDPLRRAVRAIALGAPFEVLTPPTVVAGPSESYLNAAVGEYPLFPGMTIEISREGDELLLLGSGGYPTVLVPLGGDDFFYRARYETIRFVRQEQRVTGLVWIDRAGEQYTASKSAEPRPN